MGCAAERSHRTGIAVRRGNGVRTPGIMMATAIQSTSLSECFVCLPGASGRWKPLPCCILNVLNHADVVKLADTPDLGSGAARRVGSSPSIRTSRMGRRFERHGASGQIRPLAGYGEPQPHSSVGPEAGLHGQARDIEAGNGGTGATALPCPACTPHLHHLEQPVQTIQHIERSQQG